ncbi:hypothetical protein FPV16_23030 [Methylobacterium sp. W2]|uniref:hypothetical protein n=1 Tax=Methylobacterium sp. W2 TaxID=2598107 RepID=UPI001D0CC2E4|nr:hypothetical protein [Methylobacterium sp. W2]MCC0809038.1 hypothetical protein [Methylobacterium sp. W2]
MNIEELAKKFGGDQILASNIGGVMSWLSEIGSNPIYHISLAAISGLFAGVWLDTLAKRFDRSRPSDPEGWQQLARDMEWQATVLQKAFDEPGKRAEIIKATFDVNAILVRLEKKGFIAFKGIDRNKGQGWARAIPRYFRQISPLIKDGSIQEAKGVDAHYANAEPVLIQLRKSAEQK